MDYANVHSVQIGAVSQSRVTAKDTPSRRAIFVCEPKAVADERACASKILSSMARRAYRRPVTDRDVQGLFGFFEAGRRDGGTFDARISFALARLLGDSGCSRGAV